MYVTHHTFNWLQSLSHIQLFETTLTVAHQAPLSSTISWSLLKLISINSLMPSNHLILCHHLLFLPSMFPAPGSFPMSQIFASVGQNIGASVSVSILQMNIQDRFPLGLTDLISLLSKGLSRVFSNTTVKNLHNRIHIFKCRWQFSVTLCHEPLLVLDSWIRCFTQVVTLLWCKTHQK